MNSEETLTSSSLPRFSHVCGDEFLSHSGGGSGGYLHNVFIHAAKQLFGEGVKELTYKTLR